MHLGNEHKWLLTPQKETQTAIVIFQDHTTTHTLVKGTELSLLMPLQPASN